MVSAPLLFVENEGQVNGGTSRSTREGGWAVLDVARRTSLAGRPTSACASERLRNPNRGRAAAADRRQPPRRRTSELAHRLSAFGAPLRLICGRASTWSCRAWWTARSTCSSSSQGHGPSTSASRIRRRRLEPRRRRRSARDETGAGALEDQRPVTYQVVNGARNSVKSRYRLDGGEFGFGAVDQYDHRRPAGDRSDGRLHHVLGGGRLIDNVNDVAIDAGLSAYVTGAQERPTGAMRNIEGAQRRVRSQAQPGRPIV